MNRDLFVTAARTVRREPVRLLEAMVLLAAAVGYVLDPDVVQALTVLLPALLGGEVVRRKVTPTADPMLDDAHGRDL